MTKNIHWLIFSVLLVHPLVDGAGVTSKLQVHIPKSLQKSEGYDHRDAMFGMPPYGGSIEQQVYYADSSLCDTIVDTTVGYPQREVDPNTGKMKPWPSPFILMVDRGVCTFVKKVRNAQRAGAAAVLIADNACQCSALPECQSPPGIACEEVEPVMADDGSGADISIPSFLIFKQDADPIKEQLLTNTQVRVEMSFSVPAPDSRVEFTLWTTPRDYYAKPMVTSFKDAMMALGDNVYFTPHEHIYDGVESGCRKGGDNECYNLCTNNGRYCATDPDNNIAAGLSGADMVKESLRRLCIWKIYGQDGVGLPWWTYSQQFAASCDAKEASFTDETCVAGVMSKSGIDKSKVDQCMSQAGGLENDQPNSILEGEIQAKTTAGVYIIPTLIINQAPVRGALTFASVFRAICAGYASGFEPKICTNCLHCNDPQSCVEHHGHCGSGSMGEAGVSLTVFAGSLAALSLIFGCLGLIQYRRQQRFMRDQVRGIMAEYMPLDANQKTMDTSLGLEEEPQNGDFTIT